MQIVGFLMQQLLYNISILLNTLLGVGTAYFCINATEFGSQKYTLLQLIVFLYPGLIKIVLSECQILFTMSDTIVL